MILEVVVLFETDICFCVINQIAGSQGTSLMLAISSTQFFYYTAMHVQLFVFCMVYMDKMYHLIERKGKDHGTN